VAAAVVGIAPACAPYRAVEAPLPPTVTLPRRYTAGSEAGTATAPDARAAASGSDGGRDAGGGTARGGGAAGRGAGSGGSAVPDRWWRAFGDPALDAAVETALRENFQVRAAWARVRQADALGAQASAQWWPQIGAQLDASRRRTVLVLPNFTGGSGNTVREIENNNFSMSLPVSYEVDFWDRIGSQTRAAGMDREAARADVEAQAMTVAASVVEAWLNVVYQRQLRRLLEEQVATSEAYLELQDLRLREGLGTALDVFQQRAQVEGLRAQLAQTVAQERVAEQQIAVLMGKPPGTSVVPADRTEIAAPLAPPAPGIPAALLLRRPDVRAARLRVEAADHRVAAAVADRLPRLNLTASPGFASPELGTLLQSFVYSLAASIVAPLIDGGRRAAVVEQQQAVVWERTEQLGHTLLTAVQEVEAALVQEAQQEQQIVSLDARVEAARAALEEARERYASGLLDGYLQVLTALAAVQQAEQAAVTARRQRLSFRVQLHRALGGAWTTELPEPEPRRPVGERDADRAAETAHDGAETRASGAQEERR
jgi:NodT family efflux transporter outer membrane factor (OMF) lipoprotein